MIRFKHLLTSATIADCRQAIARLEGERVVVSNANEALADAAYKQVRAKKQDTDKLISAIKKRLISLQKQRKDVESANERSSYEKCSRLLRRYLADIRECGDPWAEELSLKLEKTLRRKRKIRSAAIGCAWAASAGATACAVIWVLSSITSIEEHAQKGEWREVNRLFLPIIHNTLIDYKVLGKPRSDRLRDIYSRSVQFLKCKQAIEDVNSILKDGDFGLAEQRLASARTAYADDIFENCLRVLSVSTLKLWTSPCFKVENFLTDEYVHIGDANDDGYFTYHFLQDGLRKLRLSSSEFVPVETSVVIRLNQPIEFRVAKFKPLPGTVLVQGDPDVEVYMNGIFLGHCGQELTSLNAGALKLELRNQGYASESLKCVVPRAGKVVVEAPRLLPVLGSLVIRGPKGIEIYEGGALLGTSNSRISDLHAGSHELVLKRDGFESKTLAVSIASGLSSQFNAPAMVKSFGDLVVQFALDTPEGIRRVAPEKWFYSCDGQAWREGNDSYKLHNLEPGEHTVDFRIAGYEPINQQSIVIRKGRNTERAIQLVYESVPLIISCNVPDAEISISDRAYSEGMLIKPFVKYNLDVSCNGYESRSRPLVCRRPGTEWRESVHLNVASFWTLSKRVHRAMDPAAASSPYVSLTLALDDKLPQTPVGKDVLIVVDGSNQIKDDHKASIETAVGKALNTLDSADGFNLMTFAGGISSCFRRWEKVTAKTKAEAISYIGKKRFFEGGRDIGKMLEEVLKVSTNVQRPTIAILLMHREEIATKESEDIIRKISAISSGNIFLEVFLFGPEPSNRHLDVAHVIELIVSQNGGNTTYVEDAELLWKFVFRASKRLSHLKAWNVKCRLLAKNGEGLGANLFPPSSGMIFKNNPVEVLYRDRQHQNNDGLMIEGVLEGKKFRIRIPISEINAEVGPSSIKEKWEKYGRFHMRLNNPR